MAAGDLLVFHRPSTWQNFRRDPFGTFMTAMIHVTTRSKWNHAAIAISDTEMIEATNRGVVVSPIVSLDEIRVIDMRLDPDAPLCGGNHGLPVVARYWGPKTLEQSLAWAAGRVGWKYGYVTAALCGLRNMFPGWSIVQDKALICSQAVAEALERAGHDFSKGSERVSPGDLAEHFGVPRK